MWCAGRPLLLERSVDEVRVLIQMSGAFLQPLTSLVRRFRTESISDSERPVPAPKSIKALLLFLQLGESELLDSDLALQFGVELVAVMQILLPLRLDSGGVGVLEPRGSLRLGRRGVEYEQLALAATDELSYLLDSVVGGRPGWEHPSASAERHGPSAP